MGRPNQQQHHHRLNGGGGGDGQQQRRRQPSTNNNKRNHRQIDQRQHQHHQEQQHNEGEVDDLAFAATFAMVGTYGGVGGGVDHNNTDNDDDHPSSNNIRMVEQLQKNEKNNVTEKVDDNEIEVDSSEEEDDDSDDDENNRDDNNDVDDDDLRKHDNDYDKKDEDESDDDDDDESDIDLTEVLERMHEADDDEEDPIVTSSVPPKTEHELDVYRAPIHELEERMQIQLTVETEDQQGAVVSKWNLQQLSLAGRLKNFMVMDRTVVVESIASTPSVAQNYGTYPTPATTTGVTAGPLDEGSLLVVQVPVTPSDTEQCNSGSENGEGSDRTGVASPTKFIALGRILEVFGPVSRPLYTIRLPQPPLGSNINSTPVIKKGKGRKHATRRKEATETVSSNDAVTVVPTTEEQIVDEEGPLNPNDEKDQTTNERESTGNSLETIISPKSDPAADCIPTTENDTATIECKVEAFLPIVSNDVPNNQLKSQPPQIDGILETSKDDIVKTKESPVALETAQAEIPTTSVVDHWAPNGKYTKFLTQKGIDVPVYYIPDEAKLIDTGFVMRASGKGCDASNVYDEEVVDSHEMYYSDDDAEREAKNKRKGSKSKGGHQKSDAAPQQHRQLQRGSQRPFVSNNLAPQGFRTHSVQAIQRMHHFHRTTTQSNPPIGFHQTPPPPPPPIHQPTLPQGFHRMMPPPPPPPPGVQGYPVMHNHLQYHGQLYPTPYSTMQGGVMTQQPQTPHNPPLPPPPPPPRNPNEPAAYQY